MRILSILNILIFSVTCNSQNHSDELFAAGTDRGPLGHKLKEASGLAASVNNPGYLWTINDSDNPAEVFLIDDHARIRLVCKLANIVNRDWEDISIGAGPEPGKNYVYVADIGDNRARYDLKFIYRFREPKVSKRNEQTITKFDTLILHLPDGKRDAETLMIDPLTHDLFIVSKRESSVGLYQALYPFGRDTIELHKVCELPYTMIVAGSISADGQEVLLKNYSNIYYWKRSGKEALGQLLVRKPKELEYEPEPQGEGITWARDGSGFFTVSESPGKKSAQLKFYLRK
jgi:hypothetical protein